MSAGANVLLVEDSPGDIRLTMESFRDLDGRTNLHLACDGREAMAFLRREGGHFSAPRPDLILLDLNLPKMHGLHVLEQIKVDRSLKTIPTIVLTTSQAVGDLTRSYQLQANCYLSKPEGWDEFDALMRGTIEFWLKRVRLPLRLQALDAPAFSYSERAVPALAILPAHRLTAKGGDPR